MSDMNLVIQRATAQGWRHSLTEKQHHKFLSPDGIGVVIGGANGNGTSFDNFLGEMRRHGYRHDDNGLATLGDFMPPANGGGKLSATQYLIDRIASHPSGLTGKELDEYLRSVRPDLKPNAMYSALNTLKTKGQVEKSSDGRYRLAKAPTPPAAAAPVEIDEDIAALDSALVALAHIEGVVRRNREVLKQLAELRKVLGVKP